MCVYMCLCVCMCVCVCKCVCVCVFDFVGERERFLPQLASQYVHISFYTKKQFEHDHRIKELQIK